MKFIKLLLISFTILISACDILEENSNNVASINFSNDAVSSCVDKYATENGWTLLSDVKKLECSATDTPFTTNDVNQLSVFTNLEHLYIGQLYQSSGEYIDFDATEFSNLAFFGCSNCEFSTINFQENEKLTTLAFYYSTLPENLDLSQNEQLNSVKAFRTKGFEINLADNTRLSEFEWRGNNTIPDSEETVIYINLDVASELSSTIIYGVKIPSLKIDSDNLLTLSISWSNIGNLDVSSNSLSSVRCIHCNLDEFDTSRIPYIKQIIIPANNIQNIDVTSNEWLDILDLQDNPLLESTKEYLDSLEANVYY